MYTWNNRKPIKKVERDRERENDIFLFNLILLYIYTLTKGVQQGMYVMGEHWKIYDGANKHPTTIKWNHTF